MLFLVEFAYTPLHLRLAGSCLRHIKPGASSGLLSSESLSMAGIKATATNCCNRSPTQSWIVSENKIQDLKQLPHPKMSKLSKRLLSNMTDLDKESENRKNNQKEWNSSLEKNNILGDDINIISYQELTIFGFAFKSNISASSNIFSNSSGIPFPFFAEIS